MPNELYLSKTCMGHVKLKMGSIIYFLCKTLVNFLFRSLDMDSRSTKDIHCYPNIVNLVIQVINPQS